jgi:hypothetical protein
MRRGHTPLIPFSARGMTLFVRAYRDNGDDPEPFVQALDKYFAATPDPLTLARLPP